MRCRSAFVLVTTLVAACLTIALAQAADVDGSADHPLVGRYQGSDIVGYQVKDYDEARIVDGPFDPAKTDQPAASGFRRVEGRVVLIYYMLPQGRSTLEVMRNYEASLGGKGFRIAFKCASSDGTCFEKGEPDAGYHVGSAVGDPLTLPRLADDYVHNYFEQRGRYLLAQLDRPEGAVYVSMFFGESSRGSVAVVRVIESKEMDRDKIVVVAADEMALAIETKGRIDLYGIYFDFDKDVPRPESKPTLDEIAKMLNARPQLRLKVVGHTDNRGTSAYNMDLSRRRATGVVGALTGGYRIAAPRLAAEGAGFNTPVASNDDEAGRAKNRRVELVAQ